MRFETVTALRRRFVDRLRRLGPRRILRDRGGSAAVEFGLIAIPFFALIGAIIETALVFLAGQILETAVSDAARLIRTGQVQSAGTSAAAFKTAICDRLYILFECSGISVDVRAVTTFSGVSTTPPIDANGKFDNSNFTYSPGKASEIVVVKAYYEFPLVLSGLGMDLSDLANGKRLIGAVSAFRNEPFPW